MIALHPQFITDIKGNKVAAIIPIKEYNRIMEKLEDAQDIFFTTKVRMTMNWRFRKLKLWK